MKINCCHTFFLFCAMPLVLAGSANAQESQRKITVSGTAVSKVSPDTIIWRLNVVSEHAELPKACAENEKTVADLIKFQKEELSGGAGSEIQTGLLNIRKVYEKDRNRNNTKFKHFQVTRVVTLCQREIAKFENVYRTLSTLPDIESSYTLESSKYTDVRRETRLEAAKMARTKAKEMTEVLDSNLGQVLEISENAEARSFGYATNSIQNSEFSTDTSPDTIKGSFAPGSIEVKVSVRVVFAIE